MRGEIILTCDQTHFALLSTQSCGCSSAAAELRHNSRVPEKCLGKSRYPFSGDLHLDLVSISRVGS